MKMNLTSLFVLQSLGGGGGGNNDNDNDNKDNPIQIEVQLVVLITTVIACLVTAVVIQRVMSKTHHHDNAKSSSASSSFPSLPPVGPTYQEFITAQLTNQMADNQIPWKNKYGDLYTIPSPDPKTIPTQVVISDPLVVKELTIKQMNMYRPPCHFTTRTCAFASATRQAIGTSVTGLVGEEWQWRKEALLKEFHKKQMLLTERNLLHQLLAVGRELCSKLQQACHAKNQIVKVDVLTTRAAVQIILFFLFGRHVDFDPEEFRTAAKDLMMVLAHVLTDKNNKYRHHGVLKHIPNTKCHEMERRKVKAWRVMDTVTTPEIQSLLDEYHHDKQHGHHSRVSPSPSTTSSSKNHHRAPKSVLASLIENEPRFRSGGINTMIAETRVFIMAGFETTAHALAFALGMLAERPDLADMLAREGRDAWIKHLGRESLNDFYNWNDLDGTAAAAAPEMIMTAMDAAAKLEAVLEDTPTIKHFFMEAIRLYPLAPALGGLCLDDIIITTSGSSSSSSSGTGGDNGGGKTYGLPRGTETYFPILALQRHPVHSLGGLKNKKKNNKKEEEEEDASLSDNDPNTINPDRWNVTRVSDQPFLHTFNNGPHTCPGKNLSFLEGHVFLLLVCMGFRFEFPPSKDDSEGIEQQHVQYTDDLLLRPKDGMTLLVKRREI